MRRSTLQFHALPNEVIDQLNDVAQATYVVAINLKPKFEAHPMGWPLPRDLAFSRLALSVKPLIGSVTSLQAFAAANPNCLHVELPLLDKKVLSETVIGYVLNDEESIAEKAWLRVIQSLKKRLAAGATAIHPVTGATAWIKAHRYSAAALQAQAEGIIMKPSAGNAILMLGKA